jgi:glycerophosphoryl diester phosphodiesterase
VYGHRGARGYAPENTLEGFELAKNLGVDGIEFDVHLSKDDVLVVIHDDTVDRTTNGSGRVRDMTLSQLRELDAGVKFSAKWEGAKIPTLEEVLTKIKHVRYKIEIKHGSSVYPGIEQRLLNLIKDLGVKKSVRVTSFDYDSLKNMRALDDTIELGLIIHGKISWFIEIAKRLRAEWIQANYGLLEQGDVALAHEQGIMVGAWGVNNEKEVLNLLQMGVDDVTLDRPDMALKIMKQIP